MRVGHQQLRVHRSPPARAPPFLEHLLERAATVLPTAAPHLATDELDRAAHADARQTLEGVDAHGLEPRDGDRAEAGGAQQQGSLFGSEGHGLHVVDCLPTICRQEFSRQWGDPWGIAKPGAG